MNAGILNDLTRCIGCGACALACKQQNELPGLIPKKLDAYTWTVVEQKEGVYVRRMCMHCLEPTCQSVCPVGALHRTEWGSVVYEYNKCIGCRYCIMACPFDIPKYEWDSPLPKVGKCIMCTEKRLRHGKQPACTEVCPAGATTFGERDELVREAEHRIASSPGKYHQQIYGLKKAGGTSVLYLSPVPFATLGFKEDVLDEAYPKLTWEIIEKVPGVVAIGGLLLTGLYWVIGRRIENERRLRGENAEMEGGE